MRAKFINEDIKDILKPKSKKTIDRNLVNLLADIRTLSGIPLEKLVRIPISREIKLDKNMNILFKTILLCQTSRILKRHFLHLNAKLGDIVLCANDNTKIYQLLSYFFPEKYKSRKIKGMKVSVNENKKFMFIQMVPGSSDHILTLMDIEWFSNYLKEYLKYFSEKYTINRGDKKYGFKYEEGEGL